jgi:hypothetical protein
VLQTNLTSHGMQAPSFSLLATTTFQRLLQQGACKHVANAHFMRCGGMRRSCSYGIAGNHSFAPAKDSAALANQGLLLVTHLPYYTFYALCLSRSLMFVLKSGYRSLLSAYGRPILYKCSMQNGEVHHLDVQYLLRYPKVGSDRDAGITARGTVRGERDRG